MIVISILIPFNKSSNIRFAIEPIWIDYKITNTKKIAKKHIILISIINLDNQTKVIHPISQFILDHWMHHKFNTQRAYAIKIVKYLNYILNSLPKYQIQGLEDLTIQMGNDFLNDSVSENLTRNTIEAYERALVLFYEWLGRNSFIDEIRRENPNKFSIFSPVLPEAESSNVEHDIPITALPLFFEIAQIEAPQIALGMYLQFFGGLRASEVVNISKSNISRGIEHGNLKIEIKNHNYRIDLKGDASVKKARDQIVFQIQDVGDFYLQNHIQKYTSDKTDALFLNRDNPTFKCSKLCVSF